MSKKKIHVAVTQLYENEDCKFTKSSLSGLSDYDYEYVKYEYCEVADKDSLVLYTIREETDGEYKDRLAKEAVARDLKEITRKYEINQAIETLKRLKPEVLK